MSSGPTVEVTSPTAGEVAAASCSEGRAPSSSPANIVMFVHTETKKEEQDAKELADKHAGQADQPLWYFAIGSMCNPTSLNLRMIFPTRSQPGILRGWKLMFRGGGGMGDIDRGTAEDSFHGILHLVTPTEFKHLDSIESIYDRVPVEVECYDGTVVQAGAYKMDQTKLTAGVPDALPGERYLDIISRGLRHFHADPAYIEYLEKLPCQPRKKVSEYRLIPHPPEDAPEITQEQLKAGVGSSDPAAWKETDLLCCVHGKVMKWAADPTSSPQVALMYQWAQRRYAGIEACVSIAKTLYEPLYPIPTTYEAMPVEARQWAEELFCSFSRATFPLADRRIGSWEVIGWLEGQRNGR